MQRKAEAAATHAKSRAEATRNRSGSNDCQDDAGKGGSSNDTRRKGKGGHGMFHAGNAGGGVISNAGGGNIPLRGRGAGPDRAYAPGESDEWQGTRDGGDKCGRDGGKDADVGEGQSKGREGKKGRSGQEQGRRKVVEDGQGGKNNTCGGDRKKGEHSDEGGEDNKSGGQQKKDESTFERRGEGSKSNKGNGGEGKDGKNGDKQTKVGNENRENKDAGSQKRERNADEMERGKWNRSGGGLKQKGNASEGEWAGRNWGPAGDGEADKDVNSGAQQEKGTHGKTGRPSLAGAGKPQDNVLKTLRRRARTFQEAATAREKEVRGVTGIPMSDSMYVVTLWCCVSLQTSGIITLRHRRSSVVLFAPFFLGKLGDRGWHSPAHRPLESQARRVRNCYESKSRY